HRRVGRDREQLAELAAERAQPVALALLGRGGERALAAPREQAERERADEEPTESRASHRARVHARSGAREHRATEERLVGTGRKGAVRASFGARDVGILVERR